MPMGGVKDSGFGRELSAETLLEYSAPKVVDVDLSHHPPPALRQQLTGEIALHELTSLWHGQLMQGAGCNTN